MKTKSKKKGSKKGLKRFDILFVNTSGGKDSQAMLGHVCALAEKKGIKDRIVAVHADLGEVEWPGTRELARKQAEFYGVPFHVVERTQDTLLEYVHKRRMWPDSVTRYCTSEFKRAPCSRVMTKVVQDWRREQGWSPQKSKNNKGDRPCRILNMYGFRAEESPRRKKLPKFQKNKRASNESIRTVFDFLPIQDWTTKQVWDSIEESGCPSHWAYSRGMTRLSCRFCIFAPRSQLLLAATMPENQELWREYVELEKEIGHTFRKNQSLEEIDEAIKAGERPQVGVDDGTWEM
jgi:3'-phosphoadenosine 5'-phosphosulfate sulfotransferase (PAPS reductase)/FAD synthetase